MALNAAKVFEFEEALVKLEEIAQLCQRNGNS
jgi:hypothetical protein